MNVRSRCFLAALAGGMLASAIVLDASMRVGLSSPQYAGPIVTQPSYAPDGREVAFWTDWRGRSEIWAVSTVDGRLRPIVDGIEPAWSPNGSWIAIVSSRGGNNIWLVRPDGSGLAQLTQSTTSLTRDDQPAWSPDGTQIAFISNRAGTGGIWITDVKGTGLRRITNPNLPRSWSRPRFSPDGRQIVLSEDVCSKAGAGYLCEGSHLLIMNADGTGLQQLTTDGFDDSNPSWGPRGILFDSNRFGSWALN